MFELILAFGDGIFDRSRFNSAEEAKAQAARRGAKAKWWRILEHHGDGAWTETARGGEDF